MSDAAMPERLCQCGCGQDSGLYKSSNKECGIVAGAPRRFVRGHGNKPKHIGCAVDGCSFTHYGKGYCRFHYDRLRHRGTPDAPDGLIKNKGHGCAVDGCTGLATGKGYCDPHYRRLRKFGAATAGGAIRTRRDHSLVPAGYCWCPVCDRILPNEEFSKGQRTCRPCQRAYYEANTRLILDRNRESARRSYEQAKRDGRCAWRGGRGCDAPPDSGFVHCSAHRAEDAARHSREFGRHYAEHGLTVCWLCTRPFSNDDPAQHDHLIPKSHGGPDDPWNRAPAHRSCNNKRSNTPLRETITRWHPNGLTGAIAYLVARAQRRFADGDTDPGEGAA